MTGIYKITNVKNKKAYIGQSVDIEKRFARHKKDINCKRTYDYPLYRAIRKYGLESFTFEIIEECHVEALNSRERYWIQFYDSCFNGYNQTLGGDSSANPNANKRVKNIIQQLETTDKTHSEIAALHQVSTEMVQGINTGRYWKHDREYPIQKVDFNKGKPPKRIKRCIDCGIEITKNSTRCIKCYYIFLCGKDRVVGKEKFIDRQILKDLIRKTPFTTIGKQYGVSDNAIRKWCKKENLPTTKKEINSYSDEEWNKI